MDWTFFLYSFTTLFLIIDPIAGVPLFESLLEGRKEKEKKKMVRQALAIACVVLLVLAVVGKEFFSLFSVNMYAFRVAGGILLFIIAIEMLFGKHTKTEIRTEEKEIAKELDDIVVTPMAIPLLTGPGAITTAIVLFDGAATPGQKGVVLAALLLAFFASWLILEFGESFFKKIGPIGTKVIVRIMGLMLAGVAVQFVFVGIGEGAKAVGLLG
jgi:multiple antibiotic resistance protein